MVSEPRGALRVNRGQAYIATRLVCVYRRALVAGQAERLGPVTGWVCSTAVGTGTRPSRHKPAAAPSAGKPCFWRQQAQYWTL